MKIRHTKKEKKDWEEGRQAALRERNPEIWAITAPSSELSIEAREFAAGQTMARSILEKRHES